MGGYEDEKENFINVTRRDNGFINDGLWKWKRKRSIRSGIGQGCKRTRSVQGRVRRN